MRCMLNFYRVKNVLNIYLGYVFLGSLVEYMLRQWHGLLYQTLDGALVMAATTRYVRPKIERELSPEHRGGIRVVGKLSWKERDV